MQTNFYGHQVIGIAQNLVLAIAPVIILNTVIDIKLYTYFRATWYWIFFLWFYFTLLPNPAYLFLEIKHIILQDGVADGNPTIAVVAFSLMSLLGLITTIYLVITIATQIPYLSHSPILFMIGFSFLCAIGAVFGLLDIASLVGFIFPPIIFYLIYEVVQSWNLILLTIGLTMLFSILSITTYWLFY